MNLSDLPIRIKELRKRKGLSQEQLAENTGLSLRTIQRIENGETEPRGDSLKRLAQAFDVPAEELSDWTFQEDKGYLMSLNLSALICSVFPILGIIVTLIMWWQKRDKIKGVKDLGRDILNFQITFTLLAATALLLSSIMMMRAFDNIDNTGDVSPDLISGPITSALLFNFVFYAVFNLYNITITLVNTYRLSKNKSAKYFPKIPIIKG